MAIRNYAEFWRKELLKVVDDGTYTSPFIVSAESVRWTGAKTFHFGRIDTTGFKPHSREGGFNKGIVNNHEHPYTIEHDRDIEFFVDKAEVDETNEALSVQNISTDFTQRNAAPEVDARFFERVSKAAIKDGFYETMTGFTPGNTYSRLVRMFQRKELKKYKARGGLIAYVRGDIMDSLENSTEITKTLDIKAQTINEANGISTRIASINGVTLIEVVDDTRFYTDFDYSDGFVGKGARINVLMAHPTAVKTVAKFQDIFMFAPGQHTYGDGWLYQNRSMWDTFVFPNGADGKCDAVYVNIESGDPSVANYGEKTLAYTVDGNTYNLKADGTKVEIAEGSDADYDITLTGRAAKITTDAAKGIYDSDTVTNVAVFLVELGDDDAYYGRGSAKVTSGMTAIPDSDIRTISGTRYLVVAKGLTADKSVYGGAYFSIGSAAATVSHSFKIDASGLTLA